MCKVSLEKRQEIFSEENCKDMKEKSKTCSESVKEYINSKMKEVEEIMQNPTSYANAQRNVERRIDRLCNGRPQCHSNIIQRYKELCSRYNLDWYMKKVERVLKNWKKSFSPISSIEKFYDIDGDKVTLTILITTKQNPLGKSYRCKCNADVSSVLDAIKKLEEKASSL